MRLALILARLSFSGALSRRAHAVLSVVAVAGATTALAVGIGIRDVADRPFERTFAESNGAHVTVLPRSTKSELAWVERLPGVTSSTGALPVIMSGFTSEGKSFGIRLVGVEARPPTVAKPLVTDGGWPRQKELLVERSFARALGLSVGDRLDVGAASVRVAGIAIVPLGEAYPQSQPGIAFAHESTLASIQPDRSRWGTLVGIRLADPARAPVVARRIERAGGGGLVAVPWTDERDEAAATVRTITVILGVYGLLLLLSAGAILATLVGARVVGQAREIGLLKTTGLTPANVTVVLWLEQISLAIAGCGLGFVAGRLITPIVANESAALLQASETPSFDPLATALVAGVVLTLVTAFSVSPASRLARRTTSATLQAAQGSSSGRARAGRLGRRGLPLVSAIGLREALVRPGRTILSVVVLAVTVGSVVGTLGMEASLDVASEPPRAPLVDGQQPAWDPIDDDLGEGATLRPIVYGLDAVLLLVGLVGLLATVLLTARERVRELGLLKAVGLTPRQVVRALVVGQALVAAGATLIGIPLGLILFRLSIAATGGSDEFAYPAWWALAAILPCAVIVVAALVTPLARSAARLPVTDALRYE